MCPLLEIMYQCILVLPALIKRRLLHNLFVCRSTYFTTANKHSFPWVIMLAGIACAYISSSLSSSPSSLSSSSSTTTKSFHYPLIQNRACRHGTINWTLMLVFHFANNWHEYRLPVGYIYSYLARLFTRYGDSHVKDKTVVRPSYL